MSMAWTSPCPVPTAVLAHKSPPTTSTGDGHPVHRGSSATTALLQATRKGKEASPRSSCEQPRCRHPLHCRLILFCSGNWHFPLVGPINVRLAMPGWCKASNRLADRQPRLASTIRQPRSCAERCWTRQPRLRL